MEHEETFQMTYSARQQEEVKAIREKYMPPQEDKMRKLRALDAGAEKKATTVAIAVGVTGVLCMGMGMSLCMSEFGMALGELAMPPGICLGLVGIGVLACAYPLYNRVIKKERQRIAPEILRLADELMQ